MAKKIKTKDPVIVTPDGREIHRRFETLYWYDARFKEPNRWTHGFPRAEEGSIQGAGRVIMLGHASKIQCRDRVRNKVIWTVKRGAKVAGTHLYQPVVMSGEA